MSRRRPNWRAGSRRSAWSIARSGRRWSRSCEPGQRLVSPEGDLWRWDGFAAASNAPTAAARRLAAKNRLADLDAELGHARQDAEGKRRAVETAEAELAAAVAAEGEARNARREAQAQADAARDAHAAAEREANRLTARLSALAEAKVRLAASRDETLAAKHDATQAIEALGSAAELENQLAESRGEVAAKRAVLAEARGEAQALAREAELRAKRLAAIAAEARRMERTRRAARQARSRRWSSGTATRRPSAPRSKARRRHSPSSAAR